ncbi:hypothetical protein [Gimesia aquarii]|uniref:Uncharacterized protein n=1 Tax=Gimesia aquarii TaxID=2527964 RepID=A0A517VNH5_9PLAN|nr:hypothetical protein [Gimesia aquarii]QDT94577.1 hypothetical protein V144x_00070 [Gimesia aquarii]
MQTIIFNSYLKRSILTLCVLVTGTFACLQSSSAEEPRKAKLDWNKPIAVASIASIDRVLEDIDYLFGTVDKPEYPAMIKGFLAQYRDLEGLDKTKPLGVFVFLNEGVSPQPTVVGFVPIKNLDELTATLDEVGFVLAPVEGSKDRYTLALPNFSVHLKMAHGYAFFQLKSEALDRDFYNPDDYTRALAKEYDIAGSLLLSNVPEPMRMMAVDLLNAKMDESLPRKPGENDIQYRGRKETTLFLLKQFEMIAQDGDNLTIGYTLSKDKKQILLNMGVDAKPGSKLSNELKALSQASSQYSYLNAKSADFLGYSLLPLRKDVEQKTILDLLEQSQVNIPPVLLGDESNPGPVYKIMESVKATIRSGKLDSQIQMLQTSKEKPALIASVKLSEGDVFKKGVQDFFELIAQAEDTNGMEGNVAEVEGVTIHKVAPKDLKKNAKDFFGENPVIFIGCGPDECWLAMGEEESLDLLKKNISDRKNHSGDKKPGASFLLSLKFASIIPLVEDTAKNREFIESAKVAFAPGGDLMTFYPKITANRASLNLELGEGFIRLISLAIANR